MEAVNSGCMVAKDQYQQIARHRVDYFLFMG